MSFDTPGVEPLTTMLQVRSYAWHGIDVGNYRVGLCPNCGVVKWNRVATAVTQTTSAPPAPPGLVKPCHGVADRLRGLLGDGHGRIRRVE